MAVQSMVHQANEVRENKVTTIKTDTGEIKLSSKIVKAYLVAGGGNVSDQEVKLFIALCSAQKLNPFIKEAHLIKYGSSPATMVVSKDVYQKRADKHPEYQGKKAGIIVLTAEGKIDYRVGTFYIPSREELVGGWCEVYRKDREPERVEVSLDEYVGKKKDGTVVSGDENRLEQTKYNVEVMYIQDEKIAKIDNAVGTTCPHCGAPVTNLGAMYCEYCGLAITPINLKVWTLHRFYEVDYNHV